ncbi:phage portal protein [Paracoccus sp. MBLB3053]|uniref:Phage portal protein n=1 Tax=Paracoccus aurantius TaxID=3073814 RepID=A0ABU2HU79_9RHOB|nr:phage portal protein [Paracoccus sp. MBLB3053]MDS9468611.1 phage portal protein [Paracoccus sp. MBLB3053]
MGWIGRALDRAIGEIAPAAGRERMAARQAMGLAMNYDAASRGRRTEGWKAPATDGDAAAFGARERLRQLSRDMVRNRPYAARAREVVVSNVVGTGIVPSVVHADAGVQEQVWQVLSDHLLTPALDARGELDLYALQEVVIGTVFTDGEILARRRIRRGKYARELPLGFQVELIECDHLDTTITSWGRNEVIEGVEYSPIGDIEAYHLFTEHPGSARMRGALLRSERVSWRDVLHVRRLDRPGQLRGVPWLAPVMLTMGDLSDYQEAEILKQKMASLLAGIVTYDKDDAAASEVRKLRGLSKLEPGAVVAAPHGAQVSWTTPPRVEGYPDFLRENLGAIAMGIGITRESLTGDLSGVNFSSGRMGRMEMDRNVERWQRLVILQFCQGIERWVQEAWRLQKVLPGEAFGLSHTAPRRALIDPNDEIDAMIKAVEGGVNSRQNVQRTLGLDPERIRRERAEDETKDAAAGLAAPALQAPPGARDKRARQTTPAQTEEKPA